ncbi:MAG: DEAD/DEAH box helicase family protein [Candidatus Cloacimonetes bacterium]|nr:DEAD/DEAH box helicase family protein [Candidatus Cloacimonadota bacterium]
MKNIAYQQKYINKLAAQAKEFLEDQYRQDSNSVLVFKAPTGSGKTYIISQCLNKIVKEKANSMQFSFIWISVNSLHEQSRNSLIRYFEEERLLECIKIDEIQNNSIEENEIVFINWDSLIKENNTFRIDNERGWNLRTVVENTKEDGRQIILIIDESHRTAKAVKAKEVIGEISPILTIEMTATPIQVSGALIEIPLREIIAEGMIKKEIYINPGAGNISENKDLLSLAIKKRTQIKKEYESLDIPINPLMLIQVPNKKNNEATNPEDYIIGLLADHDITTSNGKLAIWLSDVKENKEFVEKNNSDVDVLLFKEAIAVGWDCPRAAILFLQREWKQDRYEFNIQTLGRIMRMPEQTHYPNNPTLNIGYVYSASDNFSIVQELASDYATSMILTRDENIYKPIRLVSEFIRRKRELTRLSGDFKKCVFDASAEIEINDTVNTKVTNLQKTVGINGATSTIDTEQTINFNEEKEIYKDLKEIFDSYDRFCSEMSAPYARARSTNIIKSALRSLFKEKLNTGNEDKIATIVVHPSNNPYIKQLLSIAKDKYKNLPIKDEEIVLNPNWEVPEEISIYTDTQIIDSSKKSIIKQTETRKLFVKKNKNGKIELSIPEVEFIDSLDATDDDIMWWYKNSHGESKYFSIAYKKSDGHYYDFYPDFIIRTKKETLIVEIKDDRDFKVENALKLQAGKDYVKRLFAAGGVRFWIISPSDYYSFFRLLKEQNIELFRSTYEYTLTAWYISQKQLSENKQVRNKDDVEILEFYDEFEKTLVENDELKEYNSYLIQNIQEAQITIKTLKDQSRISSTDNTDLSNRLRSPFIICILGDVSCQQSITQQLNTFFHKIGVAPSKWNIEFVGSKKLKNTNLLKTLIDGQSRFSVVITGQLHHHNLSGNDKGNLLSELKKDKYVPHVIGCSPQELLTPSQVIDAITTFLTPIIYSIPKN